MEHLYPSDIDEQYQAGLISEAEYTAKLRQAWDALQDTHAYVQGPAQRFADEQELMGEQAA